jgi:Holliday junction resolvase RusA-like endonuclease
MDNRITREMLNSDEKDANKFLIYHEEIISDLEKLRDIINSSLNEVEPGVFITRCEHILFPLPTIPRTLQKRSKKQQKERIEKYKTYLRKEFEKRKRDLELVKDKKILLYIIAYLSKKRHKDLDVDNIPKHFCDVLKEFVGDDKLIQLLILEKREVDTKNIESELCEEFLIFVAHESFKKYLFAK